MDDGNTSPAGQASASGLIQDLRAAVSIGRPLLHSDVDEIEAAIATRKTAGQEPVRLPSQTVDGELSVASAIDQVLELFPSSGRAALQTLAGLFTHPTIYRYAAPPAQAVDLGQFRECVELMEWQERGHANPDWPTGDP